MKVLDKIKSSKFEQKFANLMKSGRWNKKNGIVQAMNRLTRLQSLAFLRRIDSPNNEKISSKLESPR